MVKGLGSLRVSNVCTVRGRTYGINVLSKMEDVMSKRLAVLMACVMGCAAAQSTDEEMLRMKTLASRYAPGVRNQQNLLIESEIRKLIDSSDQRLAAAAVLEYSRLAYPSDRYQILRRARGAKIIDDDAYYGELAHGLRFSSPVEQSRMLSELETARNAYAHEILASTFYSRHAFAQLDPSARVRLFALLSSAEPGFPLALDSFGGVDAARYVTWIDAVASMESQLGGKPYAELVVGRLSGPHVDPRKILAVFGNPEGEKVVRETRDAGQLRKLLERAQACSHSLPQNLMINDAARSFSRLMAGMPSAADSHD